MKWASRKRYWLASAGMPIIISSVQLKTTSSCKDFWVLHIFTINSLKAGRNLKFLNLLRLVLVSTAPGHSRPPYKCLPPTIYLGRFLLFFCFGTSETIHFTLLSAVFFGLERSLLMLLLQEMLGCCPTGSWWGRRPKTVEEELLSFV